MEIHASNRKRIRHQSLMQTIYQKILSDARGKEFKKIEDSRKWFRETASNVSRNKISPINLIKELATPTPLNASKAQLVLYNYNPKTKKELPYYDTFPVVLPFRIERNGFYGFNLHYLPPPLRATLMDIVYGSIGSNLSKITYGISTKSKLFKACVKHYLNSQINSKVVVIPPKEWDLVLFLPLQRFQKQSETAVWNDSIKIIKRK